MTTRLSLHMALVFVIAITFFFGFAFSAQALTQDELDIICAIIECSDDQKEALSLLVDEKKTDKVIDVPATSVIDGVTNVVESNTSHGKLLPPEWDCSPIDANLGIGSRGDRVTKLQNYLSATGHFEYEGGATGYYGPVTQDAVAKWQADTDELPTTGYWGSLSKGTYTNVCVLGEEGPDVYLGVPDKDSESGDIPANEDANMSEGEGIDPPNLCGPVYEDGSTACDDTIDDSDDASIGPAAN